MVKLSKHFSHGLIYLLTIFCIIFSTTAFALSFDKIVVFGDSLSDDGNIYDLTTRAHAIFPLIPVIPKSPPYYQGRFANGPIWTDIVATQLNLPVLNYAFGGAWAESIFESRIAVPFGLGVQVSFFLMDQALDFHKDRHLYIIWIGGNDYISGRRNPELATTKTVRYIRDNIRMLILNGAKNILVFNLPDLGIAPQVRAHGAEFAAKVSKLARLHNQKLSIMLKKMQEAHPNLMIMEGDTYNQFVDVMLNPNKYNIKNTYTACYQGGYFINKNLNNPGLTFIKEKTQLDILNSPSLREAYQNGLTALSANGSVCAHPEEYLFWDQLHPTSAAHQITAQLVFNRLSVG